MKIDRQKERDEANLHGYNPGELVRIGDVLWMSANRLQIHTANFLIGHPLADVYAYARKKEEEQGSLAEGVLSEEMATYKRIVESAYEFVQPSSETVLHFHLSTQIPRVVNMLFSMALEDYAKACIILGLDLAGVPIKQADIEMSKRSIGSQGNCIKLSSAWRAHDLRNLVVYIFNIMDTNPDSSNLSKKELRVLSILTSYNTLGRFYVNMGEERITVDQLDWVCMCNLRDRLVEKLLSYDVKLPILKTLSNQPRSHFKKQGVQEIR